jgi:hypothetical protein
MVVVSSPFLLAGATVTVVAVVTYCSSTERLEVLPGMVAKTVVVRGGGWQRTLALGQR